MTPVLKAKRLRTSAFDLCKEDKKTFSCPGVYICVLVTLASWQKALNMYTSLKFEILFIIQVMLDNYTTGVPC